jgi:hypothetical protein
VKVDKALSLDEELERRLELVSKLEYEGETLVRRDYVELLLATVGLAALLLIIGWNL